RYLRKYKEILWALLPRFDETEFRVNSLEYLLVYRVISSNKYGLAGVTSKTTKVKCIAPIETVEEISEP
ncbi:hypothetical protein, partial [Escherichia coli]